MRNNKFREMMKRLLKSLAEIGKNAVRESRDRQRKLLLLLPLEESHLSDLNRGPVLYESTALPLS